MKSFLQHIIFIFYGLILLLPSACEQPLYENNTSDNKVQIELFTRAYPYVQPLTRATDPEYIVEKTPWVLVFKGDDENAVFVEAVQATLNEGIDKKYVFLTKQTGKCQLLILANPEEKLFINGTEYSFSSDNFTTALGGKTLSYACTNMLTQSLSTPQTTLPYINSVLPMSILVPVDKIDATTTLGTLELIRSVAKVILCNEASDFNLTGITAVVNAPGKGQLHNLGSTPITMPAADLTEYRKDVSYSPDLIEITNGSKDNRDTPLFLYESDIANNTYFIIRGEYQGEEYYYKMAIVDDNKNPISLLRNFEYTFTITNVEKTGYRSIEDAKNSQGHGAINTTITVGSSVYEVIANETLYLGVTNSVYRLYTNEISNKSFHAFTVMTNSNEVNLLNTRTITSLTYGITCTPTTIPANSSVDVMIEFHNYVPGTYSGEIELFLGNMKKIITIEKYPAIAAQGTGNIPLVFYSYNSAGGGFYEFNDYLLSGYLDNENDKNWLKLSPGNLNNPPSGSMPLPGIIRNDSTAITVDNGQLQIHVTPDRTATDNGTVYLSAANNPSGNQQNETYRIKLDIIGKGQ